MAIEIFSRPERHRIQERTGSAQLILVARRAK
jgi:hypothetical protein